MWVAGIIVAIIALPLSISWRWLRGGSGTGYLHGDCSWICDFIFRGQSGTDCRSNGGICNDDGRYRGEERRGRAGNCNDRQVSSWLSWDSAIFGSLIKFIPFTITTGFTSGIAVTIINGQLKDFFGRNPIRQAWRRSR